MLAEATKFKHIVEVFTEIVNACFYVKNMYLPITSFKHIDECNTDI